MTESLTASVAAGAAVIEPPLDTMQQAYGVHLSWVGEDGDWIAVGHHDPRTMVAAMRKAGRTVYGCPTARCASEDTFGEPWDDVGVAAILDCVTPDRAVFTTAEAGWQCWWGPDVADHPQSVAVTRWVAP